MRSVAVLYARRDSVYKTMPGLDVFDEDRDARTWAGGTPVVAHPPCRLWSRLRAFAKSADEVAEKRLAVLAVRQWGGVLEHPASSALWGACGLPLPGRAPDRFGGWTALVNQCDWGHKAEKRSWFYIVGLHPDDLPALPPPGTPTHSVGLWSGRNRATCLPEIPKREREATPKPMALWLVEVARRSNVIEVTA